jgi:hypothetical protein
MTDYAKMTPDELLRNADTGSPNSDDAIHSLRVAEIKIALRANELSEKTLDSSKATRELAVRQLECDEQASKDNKLSAESMNKATAQLANSTKWLTIATCGLVLFAAVQAFIAFLALFKN